MYLIILEIQREMMLTTDQEISHVNYASWKRKVKMKNKPGHDGISSMIWTPATKLTTTTYTSSASRIPDINKQRCYDEPVNTHIEC